MVDAGKMRDLVMDHRRIGGPHNILRLVLTKWPGTARSLHVIMSGPPYLATAIGYLAAAS